MGKPALFSTPRTRHGSSWSKAYAKSDGERAAKLHGASAYAASACWPPRAAVPASTFAGQQGIRRHEVAMSTPTSGSRMLPTDRIDYSAIADRPALKLPGGARMAIWVIVNVEEWDPKDTMPRAVITPPAGGAPTPDIPNWC